MIKPLGDRVVIKKCEAEEIHLQNEYKVTPPFKKNKGFSRIFILKGYLIRKHSPQAMTT